MKTFNIYLTGVGGQGIGLLSEILVRAGDHAGLAVKSVDTHGLAQRGGIVVSHLRFGDNVYSPLISKNRAHLVLSLERHEALRGAVEYLGQGGALVYYDTVWQPLAVRLNQAEEVTADQIQQVCEQKDGTLYKIALPELEDPRTQNIAVLACVAKEKLLPATDDKHFRAAMADLMAGSMLDNNMKLYASLK